MARRNRSSRRRESAPGWVWLVFGLGIGITIALGVYLRVAPPQSPLPQTAATASPAPVSPARTRTEPRKASASPDENRFSFYEILPQLEVEVLEDNSRGAAVSRARSQPPGSFLLQAGSFNAAADADRLQASLGLLGFESHVQRVTIDNAVFHRVRIGPIGDEATAQRAQRELRKAGIDSLLMKVPK